MDCPHEYVDRAVSADGFIADGGCVECLKAEVERLREAGSALYEACRFYENDATRVQQERWEAALRVHRLRMWRMAGLRGGEEHSKHPTGDYCVYCLSQWPCVEAGRTVMDWSDEVRARLVREEERLRYKAANLQARGKTVMAAQELVVADDIRAALGEIERLKREQDAMVEEGVAPLIEALRERAEAAEAKLAQVVEVLADFDFDVDGIPTGWPIRDRVDAALAAAKGQRVICDTHHTGGGMYYKDECPSCLAAAKGE